jgi:hypothetical protein
MAVGRCTAKPNPLYLGFAPLTVIARMDLDALIFINYPIYASNKKINIDIYI